jgi:hypothetical protein
MSVLTRSTRPNISEDAILRSHRRENVKSHFIRNDGQSSQTQYFWMRWRGFVYVLQCCDHDDSPHGRGEQWETLGWWRHTIETHLHSGSHRLWSTENERIGQCPGATPLSDRYDAFLVTRVTDQLYCTRVATFPQNCFLSATSSMFPIQIWLP